MGFLYFYLSMGHFEITVVTNSSDLRNYHIKKTRPAWFYCMTTKHTSCDLTRDRSQASSPVERYADYKTHCLHEISWANAGVTTPIPLWVRNTGRPVDVPWFRWELSNRVPSSCPGRRIPRQDPLHTTGWESLTNGWYTIIPKDKVKAESLLITEHSSHTSMCINNASLFLAYQSINWWQNSVHILLKLNDDSLFITYINYIASDNLWYLR